MFELGGLAGPGPSKLDSVRVNVPAPAPRKERHETVVRPGTPAQDVVVDDYFWMRDDSRTNPEVIEHLKAENAYTDAVMKHTVPLQKKLFAEMKGRVQLDDTSVPVPKADGYLYYHRVEGDLEYPIHCRKLGSVNAPEEVILDENEIALGHDYHVVEELSVSPDGKLLAYAVNHDGTDVYDIVIKDLATGQNLPDVLTGLGHDVVWGNDNQTLYLTGLDASQRTDRVLRHKLGTAQSQDATIYTEADAEFSVGIGATNSRRFLIIHAGNSNTVEQQVLDLNNPNAGAQVIAGRIKDVRYEVEDHDDHFFILTDDNAQNFRVMTAPISAPQRANWRELIPHDPGINIVEMDVKRDHLMLLERADGLPRIRIHQISTGNQHLVAFPDASYDVNPMPLPGMDTNKLRYSYTSLITPTTVFEYDMDTRQTTVLKEKVVVGGYDRNLYETDRVFATAADGTKIPISLVRRKSTAKSADKPLLLDGYGSYGYSNDVYFSSTTLSLLDRGFTYAVAHVRGGGELGEPWRKAGNMRNKKNTFTDFISCAEYLRDAGYTNPGNIVAEGRSAGGLLMGAVANMAGSRKDLFKAIIAGVPFVDVMNTMLDGSIPLTTLEYTEWGNPNDKDDYDYMSSYSPYDNVAAQDYPQMLITGGLHDPRVGYWEPAKWAAKLRELKTDDHRLLLHMFMTGHVGTSGRFGQLTDLAFDWAWMLDAMGKSSVTPLPSS